MAQYEYQFIRTDDADFLQLILQFLEKLPNNGIALDSVVFNLLGGGPNKQYKGYELQKDEEFQAMFKKNVRIFGSVSIGTNWGTLTIQRGSSNKDFEGPFDTYSISTKDSPGNQGIQIDAINFVVLTQQVFKQAQSSNFKDFLGVESVKHFEARDAALARLEKLVADLTHDLEDTKKENDAEFKAKVKEQDSKVEAKEKKLEVQIEANRTDYGNQLKALTEKEAKLNLQAPIAERRRVFDKLLTTIETWGGAFKLSDDTTNKSIPIRNALIVLIVVFGLGTAYFIYTSTQATNSDWTVLLANSIKTSVFLALFVAVSVFYVRWHNRWFDRHTEEEFRLRRMQLDINRAHWFVELVFQWRSEFNEPIPDAVIEKLTHNLFPKEDENDKPQINFDTLVSLLLGQAAKIKMGSSGVETEFDHRGIEKIKKAVGS